MWNQSSTCSEAGVTRSVKARTSSAAIGQESHVLIGLQALALENLEQPALGFLIVAMRQAQVARRTVFGHRAADDELEVALAIRPVAHVAAVDADDDAALRNRQGLPLRGAALDETGPLVTQFGFGALGDLQHMLAQRGGVRAGGDRQHVGQQRGGRRVGHKRCPAGLQVAPLRGDPVRDQLPQRGHGGRARLDLAGTAIQPRAVQIDVAVQRVEDNPVAAFAQARLATGRAAPVSSGPGRRLRRDHSALDCGEQRLALDDRQAEVFGALDRLVERGDLFGRPGETVITSDLQQDRDAHDSSPVDGLRATGATTSFPQSPEWKTRRRP